MPTVYSAKIGANQGSNQPEPIPALPGWTVSKEGQTEIYKITHNLNAVLNVVATPMSTNTLLSVSSNTTSYFTVVSFTANTTAPKASDFMFVAVKNP